MTPTLTGCSTPWRPTTTPAKPKRPHRRLLAGATAETTETDLLLNLAGTDWPTSFAEVIKYAGEALAIDNNIETGHFLISCAQRGQPDDQRHSGAATGLRHRQHCWRGRTSAEQIQAGGGQLRGRRTLSRCGDVRGGTPRRRLHLEPGAHAGRPTGKPGTSNCTSNIAGKQMPDDQAAWETCVYTEKVKSA